MKTFLIDPGAQTVTEIDTPAGYLEVRELIGCSTAGAVYPRKQSPRLILWIDDNGLYAEPPLPLWQINGVGDVLAGKGLLVGLDDGEGDHVDCPYSRKLIEKNVTWRPDLEFTGMQQEVEENAHHPIIGKVTKLTVRATFRTKREDSDGQA